MARPNKAASVAEITQAFTTSTAAVVTEYRGLTVAELKELRRSLGSGTTYSVVKNTLAKIAARDAGVEVEQLLEGPTAIAFVTGDPVEAAKGLRNFTRAHPLLVIKGGVLDGRTLTADDIKKLADLESREVLLAKLAGAMKASLSQAVGLFAAPLSQAARLMAALQQKAEQDPSVLAAGAGAPAPVAEPDPAAEAEPAVEASAETEAEPAVEASTETEAAAESTTSADASAQSTEAAPAAEPTTDDAAPAE